MKTKLIFQVAILISILNTTCAFGQEKEDDKTIEITLALSNAFDTMHTTAELNKKNLPCNVEKIVEEYKPPLPKYLLKITIDYVQENIDNINSLGDLVDKGEFSTIFDRMFEMFDNSMSYSIFIKDIANRSISELTEEEDLILQSAYNLFKIMHNKDGGNLTSYDSDERNGECSDFSIFKLRLKKKNLGQIIWEIKTVVGIDCWCESSKKQFDVDDLKFEYTAEVIGLFTAEKISFGDAKNSKLKIIRYQCCPKEEEKEKEEPSRTALDKDEGIEDLMPDQTIGFGAGVGFSQDFDETTFCITGEYLYQLNDSDTKGLYVGAEATHQITSFGDFNSNKTVFGGKIQYNISAVPSGETQFVAGIMGNFALGNNDFNGTKDTFTGTIFCAYGGVNVRVSENWSIGAQFPVLIFENYTFEPEGGGEFKTDATSLFINKDNPLKIIIRRRL